MRSTKRRLTSGPSTHNLSILGANQIIFTNSPKATWEVGLSSINVSLFKFGPVLVSILCVKLPIFKIAEIFQPISSGDLIISATLDRLMPRPGESKDIASNILVFPAPFNPKIATGRPSKIIRVSKWDLKCDSVSSDSAESGIHHFQTRIGITTYIAVSSLPSLIRVGSPAELNIKTARSSLTWPEISSKYFALNPISSSSSL